MNTKPGTETSQNPELLRPISTEHQAPLSRTFRISIAHAGLRRLQRWVAVKGAVTLSLKEAAEIASLEPHYFSVLFHRSVGKSFLEWRRRYRAEAAVRLIKSCDLSVSQAASLVGYRDRRSLERALKAITGRAPSSFKTKDAQPKP